MKVYLNKFLGYILISLSLSLSFGPFDGNPLAKKYNRVQLESFCQQYPQSCENMKEEERHKLFVVYPKLTYMKYLFASILFFLGIVILQKSYKHLAGIHINTNTTIILVDVISIFFLSIAAYCVWAFLLHQLPDIKIYLYDYDGDRFSLDMIALFFIPVTAILAFFASNISGQSIEIDKKGITIHYPGSSRHFKWNDIKHLKTSETFTVTGQEGMLAPRKFQTKLLVKGQNSSIELFEPGLKKTKKKIITALQQFAPKQLQDDIIHLAKAWHILESHIGDQ